MSFSRHGRAFGARQKQKRKRNARKTIPLSLFAAGIFYSGRSQYHRSLLAKETTTSKIRHDRNSDQTRIARGKDGWNESNVPLRVIGLVYVGLELLEVASDDSNSSSIAD